MDDEQLKEHIKEQLFQAWKQNPIFRENLAFLTQTRMNTFIDNITGELLNRVEDFFRYDLSNELSPPCPLHILNVEDTLDLLLENPKSFCRFGDGELLIINKHSLAVQEYDEKLVARFIEIMQSSSDKCYIGLDHTYFQSTAKLMEGHRDYARGRGKLLRSIMLKYCNTKRLYIASTLSCFYMNSVRTRQEYQQHFEKVKQLFKGRKLAIFSGNTVFKNINYNVFEYAAQRVHILTESRHAFRHYKEIMDAARKFPKDVTLCFILGPTATVLAYDLAQEGYTAWDIGHVAKDYDTFMKGVEQTPEQVSKFFAPD